MASDDEEKCDSGREGDVAGKMGTRTGFWKIGIQKGEREEKS